MLGQQKCVGLKEFLIFLFVYGKPIYVILSIYEIYIPILLNELWRKKDGLVTCHEIGCMNI